MSDMACFIEDAGDLRTLHNGHGATAWLAYEMPLGSTGEKPLFGTLGGTWSHAGVDVVHNADGQYLTVRMGNASGLPSLEASSLVGSATNGEKHMVVMTFQNQQSPMLRVHLDGALLIEANAHDTYGGGPSEGLRLGVIPGHGFGWVTRVLSDWEALPLYLFYGIVPKETP